MRTRKDAGRTNIFPDVSPVKSMYKIEDDAFINVKGVKELDKVLEKAYKEDIKEEQ